MSVLNKVFGAPYICKVFLDFNGSLTPVNNAEQQNFTDSSGNQYTWKETHFGRKTVSFSERENVTKAGTEYTQQLRISFPNSDKLRADRIEKIKTTQFVRLLLSNGLYIVMGRNDFFQNKKLQITQTSNENKTTITFKIKSMFSIGFLQEQDVSSIINFLIPTEVPNTLINI